MDNTRLFLIVALSLVSLLIWEAWQRDYHTTPQVVDQLAPQNDSDGVTQPPPLPTIDTTGTSDNPVPISTTTPLAVVETQSDVQAITVSTDVMDVSIDLIGGGVTSAALKQYPIEQKVPDKPFYVLARTPERFFIHQGGLSGSTEAPNHKSQFQVKQDSYKLADGTDELAVDLLWTSPNNLNITKRFVFRRGQYLIDVQYLIENTADTPWQGRSYQQLQRSQPKGKRSLVYTFTGAAFSTPEKRYEKFDYDDLEDTPIAAEETNAWLAILEHYFVAALLPQPDTKNRFYSSVIGDNRYVVGHWSEPIQVAPGQTQSLNAQLYIGPKEQEVLAVTAPGLELTVDYGILWFIAKPLFGVLEWIKDLTGNWGWAIIILTFLLKLMFYPLSAAGYRSMAKMRKVQPRMLAMKERYGKDRTRLNQAMMELYKEEKINPLGGCLPILVQIPVFISLYWVLLESVELRQAPFALWLTDLSSKDPFYVLPLIMGVSMWVQQKLNPAPMDPVQQKVMQILPFAFTIFFVFFPSGLVLYWVVNNILSIAQQWHITRAIERAA